MNKLTEFLTKPFLEEDILNEGARDPGIFKAIFLAGGPGSGKSFVAQKLFGIPEKGKRIQDWFKDGKSR